MVLSLVSPVFQRRFRLTWSRPSFNWTKPNSRYLHFESKETSVSNHVIHFSCICFENVSFEKDTQVSCFDRCFESRNSFIDSNQWTKNRLIDLLVRIKESWTTVFDSLIRISQSSNTYSARNMNQEPVVSLVLCQSPIWKSPLRIY